MRAFPLGIRGSDVCSIRVILPPGKTRGEAAGWGIYNSVRVYLGVEGALHMVCGIGVLSMVYGAFAAMAQKDFKRLVAYSSVSHMGFILLGLFGMTTLGLQGGLIQMINHGLSTGALFLIVGMIYDRRHTRMIEDFGGLAKQAPVASAFFLVAGLCGMGVPGFASFWAELMVFVAAVVFGYFSLDRLPVTLMPVDRSSMRNESKKPPIACLVAA